ncbi:DNA polymerase III subunit beta [Pontibacillus chungwhensis BH030062]|uniref:DNA polymerase III subunit beta n=1 Tax=Pontibacillus chungwhensis BH030062 TaxID=1385513 RepID=A0A0A2UZW1_9BACI|nr:nucleotidyltransferase domain-containing protein [Pontibacillus chungwhensis]KGP92303.1 DNA polymerase III subunit beta [Pontibacillus chungwhensis BH030062]
MRQDVAVKKIVESLKGETCVQSLFLKGSMGRNEHDEHSDIDLYCLVDEEEEASFLTRRVDHLKAYKELFFYEDIFIIAPQVLGVYEDGIHIDLFTVTNKTIQEKDYFRVLYDRDGVMDNYVSTQNLTLPIEEGRDNADDVVWFLFQYTKAKARGNDIWATEMLRHCVRYLGNLLLYRYAKDRSLLGIKAVQSDLPPEQKNQLLEIYEHITPSSHQEAVKNIIRLIDEEFEWHASQFEVPSQTKKLLELVKDRI